MIENHLPEITQSEYGKSRIFICDEDYIRQIVQDDLDQLQRDMNQRQKQTDGLELIPFLCDAISHCEEQLAQDSGDLVALLGEGLAMEQQDKGYETFISP